MKNSSPKTKEDCFAQIDAALSKEDKEELLKDDAAGFHFSLGLWLRNNWFHKMSQEEIAAFVGMFMENNDSENDETDFALLFPDSVSDFIIRKYQTYLRERGK